VAVSEAPHVGDPAALLPRRRRRDIQGLRAVSILMVIAFHAGLPVPGGFVGVDVFFVISGFVITGMLQREWAATGRLRLGAFYLRRFKRLTPALALMVTVVVAVSAVTLSPLGPQQEAVKTGAGAMLLAANLVIARTTGGYFDAPAASNALLHTWSLSVEEQFYLAFPLILVSGWLLARRAGRVRASPVLLVAAVAAVSFALALLGSTGSSTGIASTVLGFYSPFTRAWEFAAGALLAMVATRLPAASRQLATALGMAGVVMLAASLWLITASTSFPGVWTLLPVCGALLILAAGLGQPSGVTRLLATGPMVAVGDWSYSIYLWHWPLIVFTAALWPDQPAALVVAAVLSVAPALASYRYVEQPVRRLPKTTGPRLARIVAATLAPPLVLCTGLRVADQSGMRDPGVQDQLQAITAEHAAQTRGCFSTGPFTDRSTLPCVWDTSQTGTPIYLVGDSNAAQFSEAVIQAGADLGRPVRIFTTPSCPLIRHLTLAMVGRDNLLPPDTQATEFDHCAAYVDFTLRWLTHAPAGTVVVASLDQYWWDPNLTAALAPGPPGRGPTAKATLLQKGLKDTISLLQHAGHKVLVVQSIPTFRYPQPAWDPRTCTAAAVDDDTCERHLPINLVDGLQHDSRVAVEQAAATTGATVLDLRAIFCTDTDCSTSRHGSPLYSDAAHLTVATSQSLAPEFTRAIESAA
jgi:peptidoglycan/LPS O-acetylase OafA/YrhL